MPDFAPTSDSRHPATLVCHPLVLTAVAVCAINDHILKGSGWLPGAVTGKLSDVAGLFFFPILLAIVFFIATGALTRFVPAIGRRLPTDDPRLYLDPAVFLTIAVFTALNVSQTANAWAEPYWGIVTMDATDLVCLPMVVVARQFARDRWCDIDAVSRSSHSTPLELSWHHWGAVTFAVVVSVATSPPPPTITVPGYPHWEIKTPIVHCHQNTEVRGWFGTSGNDGAGFVLRLDPVHDEPVDVRIDAAHFSVWGEGYRAHDPAIEVRGTIDDDTKTLEGADSIYIPFEFDNEAAWDDKLRRGTVEIALEIDDHTSDMRFDAHHRPTDLTQTYYGHEKSGARQHPWGQAPDEPGVEVSGRHTRRQDEFLRYYPARPNLYWVRFEPSWRGRCPEVANE